MRTLLFLVIIFSSCTKISNEPIDVVAEVDSFKLVKYTPVEFARPIKNNFNKRYYTIMLTFSRQFINSTWYGGLTEVAAADLTSAQQARVVEKVNQAYPEWKLNILTEANYSQYNSVAVNRRMKTIITSSTERYGNGVGGHTWRGCIDFGDGTPNFVYAPVMQNNPEWVADAAIHEIGHAIGLRHQEQYDSNCVRINTYRHGVWMGDPTTVPFAVWYYGTTIDCNTYQDDIAFLNNKLGRR